MKLPFAMFEAQNDKSLPNLYGDSSGEQQDFLIKGSSRYSIRFSLMQTDTPGKQWITGLKLTGLDL